MLVLDAAGWHRSKTLVVPDHFTLLPLPPYSPELKDVEQVRAIMRVKYLSNHIYDDDDPLIQGNTEASNLFTPDPLQTITGTSGLTPAL